MPKPKYPAVLKQYTETVAKATTVEVDVANQTQLPLAQAKIRSIVILETAKESAGRFRATLTSILSINKPLTPDQFNLLTTLKAVIDSNLSSQAIVIVRSWNRLSAMRLKSIPSLN